MNQYLCIEDILKEDAISVLQEENGSFISQFFEMHNLLSGDKRSKWSLRQSNMRFNEYLQNGVNLKCWCYDDSNVVELAIPRLPISEVLNFNVRELIMHSQSFVDITEEHLTKLSYEMSLIPLRYSFIEPPSKQKRGKKLFQYYWRGELEYDTFSLI